MSNWIRRRDNDIPSWVLAQYRQYLERIEGRDWDEYDSVPASSKERINFYDRIVYNLEGREFWAAMGRRVDELSASWRSELELDSGDDFNHVELLLEMAFSRSRWTSTLDRTTSGERKKAGAKLSGHLSQTIEELGRLRGMVEAEYSVPLPLSYALSDEALRALSAIKADADAWAASSPVVRRPNVEHPEVRYFILGVADYFKHFHDEDLYAATASLTRCVYGTSTTDEQVRELVRGGRTRG